MDPTLLRQLRRLGIDPEELDPSREGLAALLRRVSATYARQRRLRSGLRGDLAALRDSAAGPDARSSGRFERFFELASDAMFTTTLDGRITAANQALAELTGIEQAALIGRPVTSLVTTSSLERVRAMRRSKLRDPDAVMRYEVEVVRDDGTTLPVEVATQLGRLDGRPPEILGVARDIRERRAREAALRERAESDPLTGLPNRARLLRELDLVTAEAATTPSALAMIDIDRFKQINDTLGHDSGDRVLVTVARAMADAAPGHLVARLSGDEFVVLMRGVGLDEGTRVAERVRLAVAHAHVLARGERVHFEVSAGVAAISRPVAAQAVLAAADAALYQAKLGGRNRVVVDAAAPGRRRDFDAFVIADAFFEAIADDRLDLVYQPIVDLRTGEPIAHETLVQMRNLDGTVSSPEEFVGALEQIGAVPTLDRCLAALSLQALRQHPALRVFMRLATSTIRDGMLFDFLEEAFRDEPALPRRMTVEITESATVLDVESTRESFDRLRRWGCRLSLDESSNGYSFVNIIRDLPITGIRIGESSIASFVRDPRERALVRALQTLADGLGLVTLAGGIDGAEQLELARHLGVGLGQGSVFGRPARVPLTVVGAVPPPRLAEAS